MWFERLEGIVDVRRLAASRIVVVGAGHMGSRLALHLGRTGAGRFRFIDHDLLADHNVTGHVLDARHLNRPKATALAVEFMAGMPWVRADGVVHRISHRSTDAYLVELFRDADLVLVTTDDLATQYRAGRVAAALDIPAVFPGLYREHGGEIFVGLGLGLPCFECFSRFRPLDAPLRAVPTTSHASLMTEQAAVHVALGVLLPGSAFSDVITGTTGTQPRQLISVENFAAPHDAVFRDERSWSRAAVQRRPDCAGCRAAQRLAVRLAPASPHVGANTPRPAPPGSSVSQSTSRPAIPSTFAKPFVVALLALLVAFAAVLEIRNGRNESGREPVLPTVALVHLRFGEWTVAPSTPKITVDGVGSIYVEAPQATSMSLTASAGALSHTLRLSDRDWAWVYYAPSSAGRVTLQLESVFRGPSAPTQTTPLYVTVTAR